MRKLFMMDIDTILEVYKLAQEHGKKEGDNIEEEFLEVVKRYPDKFTYLGETNKDKDLLVGDLREEGFKVLDLDEEKRKKEKENKC